jgi:hypothetical protein
VADEAGEVAEAEERGEGVLGELAVVVYDCELLEDEGDVHGGVLRLEVVELVQVPLVGVVVKAEVVADAGVEALDFDFLEVLNPVVDHS